MTKLNNITGQTFGKLIVLSQAKSGSSGARWNCQCDCGQQSAVFSCNLISGKTLSCGCGAIGNHKTHGKTGTAEYIIWSGMRQRCNDANNPVYHHYGGRGITICDRWGRFDLFLKDMGNRPSSKYSIDRINNDGNYEQSNCRWATRIEQSRNKRKHKSNTSGENGVYWYPRTQTWIAKIGVNGKSIYLGSSLCIEDAVEVRKAGEERYWS